MTLPTTLDEHRPLTPEAQMEDVARLIAQRLRRARAHRKISRKQLAGLADVSERYLSQLEAGEANASIAILIRVAHALDLDFRNLLAPEFEEGQQPGAMPTLETKGISMQGIPHVPFLRFVANLSAREQEHLLPQLETEIAAYRRTRQSIALLGLRGAGKSTIGRAFAERHGLPFVSVTREVESRAGMSLGELFNLGGPEAYRLIENEVVEALADRPDRIVLETSGGIVGNSEALDRILARFKTIWLKADPEDHLTRVASQGDDRPMKGHPRALDHLKTLLRQRETEYARAEAILDTSGRSVEACVAELEDLVGLKAD
ncbi:MAG: hypothetical protein RL291_271 [Pseudomonadota bacterium]